MSTPYKKTVRAQFWLTPELDKRLEQVLATQERGYTRAELIRDALRRYLDQESEVLGSKAHQVKTFQKHGCAAKPTQHDGTAADGSTTYPSAIVAIGVFDSGRACAWGGAISHPNGQAAATKIYRHPDPA